MEDSTYYKLMLKNLSGSISLKEKGVLHTWLESDEKNKKLYTLYEQIWHTTEKDNEMVNMKTAWNTISKKAGIALSYDDLRIDATPEKIPTGHYKSGYGYQILRYAAVFVVAFSLVFLFKKTTQTTQMPEQQQVLVQYGKQSNIVLPDGSRIVLDAGSKLSFPKKFAGDSREVFLSGEAYFEVKHNPAKPFIIYANEGIITVLGTKFNVRAWKFDDNEVKVAVAEGIVSLQGSSSKKEKAAVITKGEMSYLTSTHLTPTRPKKVNIEDHLAWMRRELILESTPLNEVLDRLSRWYNLRFRLPSPVYNHVKITGTFQKKSVGYILEVIGLMTHLDYKRENNLITFYARK